MYIKNGNVSFVGEWDVYRLKRNWVWLRLIGSAPIKDFDYLLQLRTYVDKTFNTTTLTIGMRYVRVKPYIKNYDECDTNSNTVFTRSENIFFLQLYIIKIETNSA